MNEKCLATTRTKTYDQKRKSLVKSEREHVWRANFKRSLEMVEIGPMETDRPFQTNPDFSKNTCLKASLHNIYP